MSKMMSINDVLRRNRTIHSAEWAKDRVYMDVTRGRLEEMKEWVRENVHPSVHVIYNIID